MFAVKKTVVSSEFEHPAWDVGLALHQLLKVFWNGHNTTRCAVAVSEENMRTLLSHLLSVGDYIARLTPVATTYFARWMILCFRG